jgi:hypothetical protein
MVVFPEETKFYTTWQKDMEKRGVKVRCQLMLWEETGTAATQIRLNTEVDAILERSSKRVRVLTRPRRPQPDHHNPNFADQDLPQTEEEYDEIVLACLADTSKLLLGKTARWVDRAVLGATKWSDDITVTHNVRRSRSLSVSLSTDCAQDADYMRKHYTVDFDEERARPIINGRDDTERVDRGKKDFNPYVSLCPRATVLTPLPSMYLIKQTPKDPRKLEMCACRIHAAPLPL